MSVPKSSLSRRPSATLVERFDLSRFTPEGTQPEHVPKFSGVLKFRSHSVELGNFRLLLTPPASSGFTVSLECSQVLISHNPYKTPYKKKKKLGNGIAGELQFQFYKLFALGIDVGHSDLRNFDACFDQ